MEYINDLLESLHPVHDLFHQLMELTPDMVEYTIEAFMAFVAIKPLLKLKSRFFTK